ncbi:DUF1491 family protein [Mesorhizobium koreense]|jgi:hypothetical protein|uniref:DUF1491 family protein n=1 Tax=Mesorhizobium koreense TaxID=3074855 RepID=UPI00287B8BA3|nr:DUF1491 family protein [Mesorhizobium sp. WR6]
MRVTSDLWVSALLRRVQSAGGFGAVLRRGASEAGAIFIVSRSRLGEVTLYGPAPQVAYEEGKPQERGFSEMLGPADDAAIEAKLEKERRFDPDLWVVEIETGRPHEELFPVRTS